ncbi:MAG: hypothetical protein ACR2PA_24040, partial [Hyphomicrobiaceae bacterium]
HQLLASAPTESRKVFERLGVDYLLLCSSDSKRLSIANKDALINVLSRGEDVPFLEPMPVGTDDSPLRLWRYRTTVTQ